MASHFPSNSAPRLKMNMIIRMIMVMMRMRMLMRKMVIMIIVMMRMVIGHGEDGHELTLTGMV